MSTSYVYIREAAKKVIFLVGRPLRGGGGLSIKINGKISYNIFLIFEFDTKNKDIEDM